jgi:hypothetical protein
MKPDREDFDSELQSMSQQSISESRGKWRSPIIRAEDGRVIGVTLFFTPDDLDMLGIDTHSAKEVLYEVTENGSIHINNFNNPIPNSD